MSFFAGNMDVHYVARQCLIQLCVESSIEALSAEDGLSMTKSPVSSRVFDVLLESSTVPYRSKRALVTAFIGQFHLLVNDRVGSFVAEKLWQAGDPYLRVRCIPIHSAPPV